MNNQSEDSGAISRLEHLSKAAVFSIGVFYVIGLIVVNSELGLYGVHSMELGRPEYILAGALWVFLAVLPILVLRFFRSLMPSIEWKVNRDYLAIGWQVLYLVFGLFVFSWFLQMLSDGELSFVGHRQLPNWPGTIATLVAASAICSTSLLLAQLYRTRLAQYHGREFTFSLLMDRPDLPFSLAYILMTALIQLSLYSTFAFPHLGMQYGGGKHPNVEVVLSRSINFAWKENQIPVSSDGLKIGPALLLLETPDTIVITKPSADAEPWGIMFRKDAFALNKSSIIAYRFVGSHPEETPKALGAAPRQAPAAITH